jgi:uncharacterized protein (DUF2252 family)
MCDNVTVDEAALVHLSVSERKARGRSARTEATRSSHSALDPAPDRDAVAWLQAEEADRLPELLPIRYGRMLASPFVFFRGAATVMAHDLAVTPNAGLRVQLSGDAHLLNFGGFASPEGDLVFDLNDFDETLPGPFEWDVKRLATSIEVAGRDRGIDDPDRGAAVRGTVRAYRKTMRRLARLRNLDAWSSRLDAAALVGELRRLHETHEARAVQRAAAKAYANDHVRAPARLTHVVDGEPRIVSDPPLIVPIAELTDEQPDLETRLRSVFRKYGRSLQPAPRRLLEGFRYGDLARKVVGVGSVGTRCWMLLLLGRNDADPLFLQLKTAGASVLEPFLGASEYAHHAQRVVEGQRLSQAASDIFLGWVRTEDLDGVARDFYVRQLRNWKVSIDLQRITSRGLATYARYCGATLARAHARTGDRVAIAAYLGKGDVFDRAVAEFAGLYADVNEADHAALVRAASAGRISAQA